MNLYRNTHMRTKPLRAYVGGEEELTKQGMLFVARLSLCVCNVKKKWGFVLGKRRKSNENKL